MVSCKSDSNDFVDDPVEYPEFLAYINATVDGEIIKTEIPFFGDSDYEANINYTEQTDNTSSCINLKYEPGLNPIQDLTLPKFNVGFVGFLDETTQNCNDELSVFDTLLEENTFNYTQDANGQGVSIKYFETSNGTGLVYTSYGSQDNTASFEIIEVEILDCEPKRCVNVYGTFTATLYNASNSSETIVINNGTFKLKVESFN